MGLVPTRELGRNLVSSDGADPINLLQLAQARMQQYRGGQIAMIFQEPMSSLNPVYVGFS